MVITLLPPAYVITAKGYGIPSGPTPLWIPPGSRLPKLGILTTALAIWALAKLGRYSVLIAY
jgi:hypothetical protein